MLVQTTMLRKVYDDSGAGEFSTLSLLTKIASRKIPMRSSLNKNIRSHQLDFRKAYGLRPAA